MTTANETNVDYVFLRRYSDEQVAQIVTRENPTFHAIAKQDGFDGVGLFYGITYGNPQGVSSGFASAQSGSETLKGVQLAMYRKLKYGVITLDGPAMMAASGNKGSFFDFVTRHTDGILEQMGQDLAFDLFRDGSGMRGQRSSIIGNVVTLVEKRHTDNFKVGMTVVAAQNADGTGARAGSAKVTKLTRSAKQVTLDDQSTIIGFADNDFLFRKGDPGNCIEGMESATPLSAPGAADSFRTINRSADVEALAGSRLDDVTVFPEESLGDVAVEISTIGKKVKRGVVYPTVFQQIVKRTGAQVQYEPGDTADIGFEFINLLTTAGRIQVYSDADCPVDRGRVFRPDTHLIKHLGELVHIIRTNGKPHMQTVSADGIEIRARFMGNYVQLDTAPHGVVHTRSA
jgi:hypothetical protein